MLRWRNAQPRGSWKHINDLAFSDLFLFVRVFCEGFEMSNSRRSLDFAPVGEGLYGLQREGARCL